MKRTDDDAVRRQRRALILGALGAGGAAATMSAPPAAAAPGDPLVLGTINDTGQATTTLTGGGYGDPVMVISNTGEYGPALVVEDHTYKGFGGIVVTSKKLYSSGLVVHADNAITAEGRTTLSGPTRLRGVTSFQRSGSLTVRRGHRRASVGGVEPSPAAKVIASVATDVRGVALAAATFDRDTGRVSVFLTKAAPSDVRVNWLVID